MSDKMPTNIWTNEVKFTAEIDCDEKASNSIKLGLATKWAVKTGSDLRCSDLEDANGNPDGWGEVR